MTWQVSQCDRSEGAERVQALTLALAAGSQGSGVRGNTSGCFGTSWDAISSPARSTRAEPPLGQELAWHWMP